MNAMIFLDFSAKVVTGAQKLFPQIVQFRLIQDIKIGFRVAEVELLPPCCLFILYKGHAFRHIRLNDRLYSIIINSRIRILFSF